MYNGWMIGFMLCLRFSLDLSLTMKENCKCELKLELTYLGLISKNECDWNLNQECFFLRLRLKLDLNGIRLNFFCAGKKNCSKLLKIVPNCSKPKKLLKIAQNCSKLLQEHRMASLVMVSASCLHYVLLAQSHCLKFQFAI